MNGWVCPQCVDDDANSDLAFWFRDYIDFLSHEWIVHGNTGVLQDLENNTGLTLPPSFQLVRE